MNILILYQFYNQNALLHNFAEKLKDYDILADYICIGNLSYERISSVKWPMFVELAFSYYNRTSSKTIKRILNRFIHYFILGKIFPLYSIVDFHGYYPSYNRLMHKCSDKKIKFDITLWGSDLMRATEQRRLLLKYGFDRCYRIKMTESLHDTFIKYYGNMYENKCRIVYFGNNELSVIDSLNGSQVKEIKNQLYGDTDGKKIVVCGYNGVPSQNHNLMIEALTHLNEEEKKTIHIVFPMTYGANNEYLNEIKAQLEKSSMTYTVLDTFLSTNEVAAVRKTADIVLNIQDTDALAGSLMGHLFCGNVCIFGEWLNYSVYTKNNIFYIKTGLDDITSHLKDILLNYTHYHMSCKHNHDIIKKLFSWDATIKKQVLVYGE